METGNLRKIFGIGFQKTGTSTLGKALKMLNYKVCDHCPYLLKALKRNDWKPVFDVVRKYDAFEDNPWPLIYQKLDQVYPNSKFILTMRDEDAWLQSALNHFGHEKSEMRLWIYKKDCLVGNEEIYLETFREHNRAVLEYFKDRPDDLLIVNWEKGEGWEQLCGFLDEDIPPHNFPHINKGIYSKVKDMDFDDIKSLIKTYSFRFTRFIITIADSTLMKCRWMLFKKN